MHASRHLCQQISSVGFSGAGFLAVYHLGVVKCLLERKLLQSARLTGVSAGALISASVLAGVDPELGLEVAIQISKEARNQRLDTLHPGFSLVDVVDQHLVQHLREAIKGKEQEFLLRINQNKLLRIGLTDSRVFPGPRGPNHKAFCYVDEFTSIEDVIAACILSSYIPGITGPVMGSQSPSHYALKRAKERIDAMWAQGRIKQGRTGEPLELPTTDTKRELIWDGGLVNAFPFFDSDTIIVCPLAASFSNNPSINPSIMYQYHVRTMTVSHNVDLHLTRDNLITFRRLLLSSDESSLRAKFEQGYTNAAQFLDDQEVHPPIEVIE